MKISFFITLILFVTVFSYFVMIKRYPIRKLIRKRKWDYYKVLKISDLDHELTIQKFLIITSNLKIRRDINYYYFNRGLNWLFSELKENEKEVYFKQYKISKLDFDDIDKRCSFLKNTLEDLTGCKGFIKP